ncbi:hypothetical protein Pmar_PMAR023273 [Perkinsus marinus ATCC 50983]|uniref:Uncharacterized protein n=1 Tax=Perkinsus marinus (strain ATCC 50983 / TXsc) TaxID=423536 RepID=C5KK37_PERM5|nr:hypothetical protein Pmar_PMAR023273 [Perkinsus marinus ATCC 50983]EER14949.1 hypothetical protein Pmar_PMAR023273 [Perkinsus marinus ATCC 50983]|eukprot:XP_002783153.1 hypothetical protein Pmar_PMAR023273 [Perkinsus marinus ATCC 50983]
MVAVHSMIIPVLISGLVSFGAAQTSSLSSSWCKNNEAEVVYDRATMGPDFLPKDGVDMIDYDFDGARNWYMSGKDLGTRRYELWKVTADGSVRTDIIHDKVDCIAVKADGSGIFAVVNDNIGIYNTNGDGIIEVVDNGSHRTWSGLYYDDVEKVLYASDSANNMIYMFVRKSWGWDSTVIIKGTGQGSKKLDQPAGIRKFGNTLYIVQSGGRSNVVVSWDIGSNTRNFEYDFKPTGEFGIEVLDGLQTPAPVL